MGTFWRQADFFCCYVPPFFSMCSALSGFPASQVPSGLLTRVTVLGSWGCQNQLRQAGLLKATGTYSIIVPEVRSLPSRCQQHRVPLKTVGKNLSWFFLVSSGFGQSWHSLVDSRITPISASFFAWLSPLYVPVYVLLLLGLRHSLIQ